jgi:phage terminase large subunit
VTLQGQRKTPGWRLASMTTIIIKKELAAYKPTLRVASKAPGVVARANFINSILEIELNGISLEIDSRCTNTIKDYLYLKEDADGTKKKERVKDSVTGITSEKYGHTSDANDYFLCQVLSKDFEKYQGKRQSNYSWLSALP